MVKEDHKHLTKHLEGENYINMFKKPQSIQHVSNVYKNS